MPDFLPLPHIPSPAQAACHFVIAFSIFVVYNIFRYPGVAQLGSEATAASGGVREPSEWQRSKFHERIASKKFRAPQQEGRLIWELEHQTGSTAPNVGYSPVYLRNPANTAVESSPKMW